jgi:hypothetical protein
VLLEADNQDTLAAVPGFIQSIYAIYAVVPASSASGRILVGSNAAGVYV